MKNIHVLPTDKPSILFKFANQLHLDNIPKDYYKKYNIYITSDETIKDDDYGLDTFHKEIRKFRNKNFVSKYDRKIILTTDSQLIKNGVQAIDDEFLEWFVKNPSCESVEVEVDEYRDTSISDTEIFIDYKIIIPKEQPKQEIIASKEDAKIFIDAMIKHPEPNEKLKKAFREYGKQETLEEFAERIAMAEDYDNYKSLMNLIIEGAKWQQEQDKNMYSEEEVDVLVDMLQKCKEYFLLKTDSKSEERADAIGEVLKQFKKK